MPIAICIPAWPISTSSTSTCSPSGTGSISWLSQQQQLVASVATLQASCVTIAASLEQMMSLIGAVIPAWTDQEEVESGDDMGMVRPSAAALGLTVVFETVRQAAGFGHHEVVSISPPAGTLVAKGSTVTVVINLEG